MQKKSRSSSQGVGPLPTTNELASIDLRLPRRRQSRFRIAGAFLATCLAALALIPNDAPAQGDAINKMLMPGEDTQVETQTDETNALNPGLVAPSDDVTSGFNPSNNSASTNKERWIKGERPIDHFQLISAHPNEPGDTCHQIIFDARKPIKRRHEPKNNSAISLNANSTCLLGLRNDSDDRAIAVRLGEEFASLAIVADPEFFTGKVIAPRQQIMIPLRPLSVNRLDVSVELVWDHQLDSNEPEVDNLTLRFLAK